MSAECSTAEVRKPVVGGEGVWEGPSFSCMPLPAPAHSQWQSAPCCPFCRMVFALFTVSTLFIYDTSCAEPLAVVSNLHLATITDACWAPDGYTLMVCTER